MERGYNEKYDKKSDIKSPGMWFWGEKKNRYLKKIITFNIPYFQAFQNVRNKMEELHILFWLLIKRVKGHLQMIYGFDLARSLRIAWLEPNQPNLRKMEDVNRVGKNLA